MNKIIFLLGFLFLLFYSCDSTEPTIEDKSDEVTINNGKNGFSFSYGSSIPVPDTTNNIIPDIIIFVRLDDNGTVLGVFFGSDTLRPAFNLIKEFSNIDSAKTFFYDLSEVPDSNYQDLALPVKAYQIWAVKTHDNKYGKILIISTDAYEYSPSPGFRSYHLEATFKWKYQPNGSRNF